MVGQWEGRGEGRDRIARSEARESGCPVLHLIGFVAAVSLSDASFVPRLQRFEIAAALDEHGTEEAAERNQKSEEVDQSAVVATEKELKKKKKNDRTATNTSQKARQ